ncbi:hypothetical protein BDQ12DRAFT_206046 [Crucibulum laeve]|uniref:Uncharacterized protein n=1 Tax=Crucibulum laeve TaxID=68775 RepID=A0A5C3LVF2_9AGAR|nr:hypothetical protein BDQ12DRAFT_206046 [Crucibulum laeve]
MPRFLLFTVWLNQTHLRSGLWRTVKTCNMMTRSQPRSNRTHGRHKETPPSISLGGKVKSSRYASRSSIGGVSGEQNNESTGERIEMMVVDDEYLSLGASIIVQNVH